MRGHLRIRSERSPYRRAGLAFPESRELEVAAGELDGARLRVLVLDPALRVDAWDGERYRPVTPALYGKTPSEEDFDFLLAELAKQAPPAEGGGQVDADDGAAAKSALEVVERRAEQLNAELAAALGAKAELAGQLQGLADALDAREGFTRLQGEDPCGAALRVIAELDFLLAAAPGGADQGDQQQGTGEGGGELSPPADPAAQSPPPAAAAVGGDQGDQDQGTGEGGGEPSPPADPAAQSPPPAAAAGGGQAPPAKKPKKRSQ